MSASGQALIAIGQEGSKPGANSCHCLCANYYCAVYIYCTEVCLFFSDYVFESIGEWVFI